jgi:serpin B
MKKTCVIKGLLGGLWVGGVLGLFAACSDTDDSSSTDEPSGGHFTEVRSELARNEEPVVSAEDELTLAQDNAAFACALHAELRAAPGNLAFSPHSVSTALVMTYAGARGSTAEEMAAALHFTLPDERLHAAFNALDLRLGKRLANVLLDDGKPAVLRFANSIWAQVGLGLRPEFLDVLAVNYGAGVKILDFAGNPEQSSEVINRWASDETEALIPELLPFGAVNLLTTLVLVNATYLHAPWAHPFESNRTSPGIFHVDEATDATVHMMQQTEQLSYLARDGLQAVRLPYAGSDLAMWILLPDAGRFDEVEADLSGDGLSSIADELSTTLVSLTLPKFHVFAKVQLQDALSALGMPSAFADAADFSGMSDNTVSITQVYHDTDITVDEAGTEAAAATAVAMQDSGVNSDPIQPVEVIVDRPFLFLLRDDPTGAILFLGRVIDPSQD